MTSDRAPYVGRHAGHAGPGPDALQAVVDRSGQWTTTLPLRGGVRTTQYQCSEVFEVVGSGASAPPAYATGTRRCFLALR